MTGIQRIALIFGVGFLAAALAGFLATGMSNMDPDPTTAPRALGLFPVNVLHNIVHLAFGLWGLAASRSVAGSRNFARISGVMYLLLVVLGFVAPSTFGLMPIGGNDIWLHLILGAGLTAAGFMSRDVATTTRAV